MPEEPRDVRDEESGPPHDEGSNSAAAENSDQLVRDCLRLALTRGIGGVSFRRLVDHFGSPAAVLRAGAGEIAELRGFGDKRAAEIVRSREAVEVESELALAAEHGVTVVPFGAPDYPPGLMHLDDPPIVLYVRGELWPQDARGFAIVGSRRSSLYGQQQSERFAVGLAQVGFTVVSGLARGVDSAAHAGAVKVGGRTIAVLGNGLATVYPPENAGLADQVAAHGAVISEFPMATAPEAENFPRRNRIISGLSLGVLVVEASLRSGALITATAAGEQGKEVFAIPGRIDSPFSLGAHQLIQKGAKLVTCLEDILDEFPDLYEPRAAAAGGGAGQGELPLQPQLDAQEQAVMAALRQEPVTADEIAAASGLAMSAVSANLTILELKRLVQSLPGQRFVRRSARP